jgi:pimeloyl-ACP methyl ester carboxylesterase
MAGDLAVPAEAKVHSLFFQGQPVRVTAWERESGATCILLLHGLGCSKRSFQTAFTSEALRSYSLLALDLVGFGSSSRSADFRYDLMDQADLCAQVMALQSERPVHLVAHSLGGTVASLLAPSVLVQLQSLTLVEGRLLTASCSYSRLVSQLEEQDFVQRYFPTWCKRFMPDSQLALDLEEADPVAVYRSARSLYHWVRTGDLSGRLAACPALKKVFLYGQQNRSLGEIDSVPGMQSYAISQAGHFPMHDNPEAFYTALAKTALRKEP